MKTEQMIADVKAYVDDGLAYIVKGKHANCAAIFKNILKTVEAFGAESSTSLARANRFALRCPHCDKEGTNSRDAGGNEKCFHCGDCGFVECEWSSSAHEVVTPEVS